MTKTVAVIGVGNMGGPMARRVHGAGFDLTVCDKSSEALLPFLELGVKTASRASDCALANLIIILVATSEQVSEVIFGPGGIRDGLREGRKPLVAVMSTVSPKAVITLQEQLKPFGLRVIDAPVSGGIVRARDGTLTILAGGDPEDIAEARPVLESMGANIFVCGKLGAGEALKIVNNIVGIANITIGAEAYYLAGRQGLSFETIAPILEVSTGRNFLSQNAAVARASYAAWTRSERDFESLKAILQKDIALAREFAAAEGKILPVLDRLAEGLTNLNMETFAIWEAMGKQI